MVPARFGRRRFLGALLGAAAVPTAGCLDRLLDGGTYQWPTMQGDPANTGYRPDFDGPGAVPDVAWRTDTWGGVVAPVVAGDTVVAAAGLVEPYVVGIDAASGDVRWRTPVDEPIDPAIAAADGRAFVGGLSVSALDLETGVEEWRIPSRSGWGVTVADGLVLFRDRARSRLHAVEADAGDERWRAAVDATALPAVREGGVYVTTHDTVVRLDGDSGEDEWTTTLDDRVRAAPTVAEGLVIAATGAGVAALEVEDGSTAWTHDGPFGGDPAVADGTVVAPGNVDGGPAVVGLALDDGDLLWTFEDDALRGATPVVAGDTVYLTSGSNRLVALELGSGEVLWDLDFDWTVGVPAISEGHLYASIGGRLHHLVGGADGRPFAGLVDAAPPADPDPSYAESDLYFGTHGYDVEATVDLAVDGSAPLDVAVDVSGDRIDDDAALRVSLAVTNVGDATVTYSGGATGPFGRMTLEATDGSGRRMYPWRGDGEPDPTDPPCLECPIPLALVTERLEPGEAIEESYILSAATPGLQPGRYRGEGAVTLRPAEAQGEDPPRWEVVSSVEVDVEASAPEAGGTVHDLVVLGDDGVDGSDDLPEVRAVEPATADHPGVIEASVTERSGRFDTPEARIGVAPDGRRAVLMPVAGFAPAYLDDRDAGTWAPRFPVGTLKAYTRWTGSVAPTRRFLVLAHPDEEGPLGPGTYRFEEGLTVGGEEATWGFEVSLLE